MWDIDIKGQLLRCEVLRQVILNSIQFTISYVYLRLFAFILWYARSIERVGLSIYRRLLTEQHMNRIYKISIFAYLNSAFSALFSAQIYLGVFGLYHRFYQKKKNRASINLYPASFQSPEEFTKWFMCCSVK